MSSLVMVSHIGMAAEAVNGTKEMTREAFAVQLVEKLGYKAVAKNYDKIPTFTDVKTNNGAVYVVSQLGLMNGVDVKRFNPKEKVTPEQQSVIGQRIDVKLEQELGWQHGFYAIASSSQMDLIKGLDAVSFGWAGLEYDVNTGNYSLETEGKGGFSVPEEFQIPMDHAKENEVETYLMVYFEDKNGSAKQLFNDETKSAQVIADMVAACTSITQSGETRSFDGVTVDFENFMSAELRIPYNKFLLKLDEGLAKEGKKLNVAVQPGMYFKGYDYKTIGEIADHVILMAHDYAPKKLSPLEMEVGSVHTPLTPIAQVYRDLLEVIDPKTGIVDKSKVALQISFATAQWQTKDSKVLNQLPYTPTYDKVLARLAMPDTKQGYDELSQNPYATYTQDGISNMIWYEDERSVEAKENLGKLIGIGGVSYWRLGNIPQNLVGMIP